LETLVLYIFHVFHSSLRGPLQVSHLGGSLHTCCGDMSFAWNTMTLKLFFNFISSHVDVIPWLAWLVLLTITHQPSVSVLWTDIAGKCVWVYLWFDVLTAW
jgi:hypothetical protein